MKILHVITRSDLGGAQSVVINLANAMCREHEITVVAGEDGPMWDALHDKVKKIRIAEIVREISITKDIMALYKLRKIYQSLKPDVIHLHSSKIGVLGRLAFPSRKNVYSIHGFDSIRLAYRKFLPLEKLLKNRCKAIVLASNYDKRNIIAEGISNRLHVIYNGVHLPEIDKSLKIKGVEDYKATVMCIARISPQKRFESFLQIAKILPQYAFVWIGADEDYENLPSNVFCIKRAQNAKKFIQLADLFVLPTNYEGVPIVLIDALSYGKPIVSSDVGGIAEIVKNDFNGFVLENDDNCFAEKIKFILENSEILEKFSKNSKDLFNESLNIDEMVKKYTLVYEI